MYISFNIVPQRDEFYKKYVLISLFILLVTITVNVLSHIFSLHQTSQTYLATVNFQIWNIGT